MTMTHKEALDVAMDRAGVTVFEEDYDALIRAYIEARGLALVPKTISAGGPLYEAVCDYVEWPTAFWNDMLAAAPDPFGGE